MGWELPLVKRALRQLQWEQHPRTAAPSSRSGVTVELSELSFHLRSFGDLSHAELDAVCHFLQRRLEERQQGALRQLTACRRAFRRSAMGRLRVHCGPGWGSQCPSFGIPNVHHFG
ncbi:ATP-dependent DNA helicase Q4-like, partial [Phasianus colchicus]|uniref:ATP-dependent DNA helicase Q4-like n=1 Tax=Phasianus colchicus TaxID=9054 RepID=UPI00129E6118